jgi:hypothetical protein
MSPETPPSPEFDAPSPGSPPGPPEDTSAEIDEILDSWSTQRRAEAERAAQVAAEREQFLEGFRSVVDSTIRPTMESAAARLTGDGGGGLVEEHPGDDLHGPRVILWMSLEGPVTSAHREDLNPYLRFDADAPNRTVRVWEGDMWLKKGGSGPAAPRKLDEITADGIGQDIVGILRRAASHGTET